MRAQLVRVLAIGIVSAFLLTSSGVPASAQQAKPNSEVHVIYSKGFLTINGKDCTLQEILEALQKQTGITVEMPSMEGGARMVAHFGPDTPDKVLDALLYGTKYNYILVGATENPDLVSRIVLMEKNTTAENPPPAPAPPAPEPAAADAVASEQKPDEAKDATQGDKKDANAEGAEQAKTDDANGDKDKDSAKKEERADAKDDSGNASANRALKNATPEEIQAAAAAVVADNAPPPRADVELTEDVLKKLPKLPEGIPSALYGLYPQLVTGGMDALGLPQPGQMPQANNPLTGANAGTFQPGQLGSGQQPRRDPNDWTIPPGLPPLPPGIDPRIWLLYPPNLLELIRSAPPAVTPTGH